MQLLHLALGARITSRHLPLACAAAFALGAAACGSPQPLQDSRHPTGSQALATSSDFSALYVANTHEGSVARLGPNGDYDELDLPGDPTRIARAGGRVFVTLRTARAIAVLRDDGGRLKLERTVDVGAEPLGIVASEDQTSIYVASSLSNRVDEIDVTTLQVNRSWSVPDEPRWLALHPGGTLYVGSAWNGTLSYIHVDSDKVHSTELPERKTFGFETGDDVRLHARITGDMGVSPDGRFLVVPGMYVDNQNPIDPNGGRGAPGAGGGGYGSERFNPVVAVVPVSGSGKPRVGDARLVLVSTFSREAVTGYPSSATVDPESSFVVATIEGAGAAVAFPLEFEEPSGGIFDNFGDDDDFSDSFDFRGAQPIETAAGPRAVAFSGASEAFVYSFLDRRVERFDASQVRTQVVPVFEGGRVPVFSNLVATNARETTPRTLPVEIEAGRQLFYSTRDSRMSQPGSGVSCALCHFEGRTDGITWNFTTGARQTPSLAGQVSLTEPVRWEGDRATVEDDARFTSQSLMGGDGIANEDLTAIAAFIDWTPDVDSPLKGIQDAAVIRGKALFERSDVGCANCHNGARYTDNTSYSMFGMPEVQTRSLVGVAGSPPYLHDGSSPTLRHLLERVRNGEMGNTSALSDDDLDDLQAYLRSL